MGSLYISCTTARDASSSSGGWGSSGIVDLDQLSPSYCSSFLGPKNMRISDRSARFSLIRCLALRVPCAKSQHTHHAFMRCTQLCRTVGAARVFDSFGSC